MINLHRNKRSISLNLKEADGRAVFMRMLKTADIVVENYRPDVKDRLGIGYEVLKAANPASFLPRSPGSARPALQDPRRIRPDRARHGRANGRHRRARNAPDARRHRRRRFPRRRLCRDGNPDRLAERENPASASGCTPRSCRPRSR
jgi:hypothetical protein